MARRKGKGSSGSSGSNKSSDRDGQDKKKKPLSFKEANEQIKNVEKQEATKILTELTLDLVNQGNTTDFRNIKKIIKDKYGIEIERGKNTEKHPLENIIEKIDVSEIKDKK